jgi:hypothetical protein
MQSFQKIETFEPLIGSFPKKTILRRLFIFLISIEFWATKITPFNSDFYPDSKMVMHITVAQTVQKLHL